MEKKQDWLCRGSQRFPALAVRCILLLGAVRGAHLGQRSSLFWPCLSPATKAGNHQHNILKNTQDTDPNWVLLKCQEQAHVKVVKEGRRWRRLYEVAGRGRPHVHGPSIPSPCQGLSGYNHPLPPNKIACLGLQGLCPLDCEGSKRDWKH